MRTPTGANSRRTAATRVFIRDDDLGPLTPALTSFAATFASRRIPVSYQVIPEHFSAECAAFMLALQARDRGLVEFGQHGLRHGMLVGGKRVSYEFGPERSYADQFADIGAGQAMLRQLLPGQSQIEVFTPPRHRYDRNTLRAVRNAGFTVLSASCYQSLPHRTAYALGRTLKLTNLGRPGVSHHGRIRPDCGLFEISISVAVDSGSQIAAPVEAIVASVARARAHTSDVGLMFHHQVYRDADGEHFLTTLADRLVALPDVTFHPITELYRRHLREAPAPGG